MQRLSGSGTAFAEIDGELIEYDLAPGQKMVVDTGNVAGFEPTVGIEIEQVPGLKNKLLGGEGLFNTTLTGPGRIWLQTMPISGVAGAIPPVHPDGQRLTQPPARASGCGRKDVWKSEGRSRLHACSAETVEKSPRAAGAHSNRKQRWNRLLS